MESVLPLAPPSPARSSPDVLGRPPQARWVRFLNGLGHVLDRLGTRPARLDADRLIDRAERRTGLAAWGSPDVRGPLRVLADALEDEARLNPLGRTIVHRDLDEQLAKRLRLEDLWRRQPEILARPVDRPLIVAGMPRSGTTLLHRLLALEPTARAPRLWELQWPIPPAGRRDPRPARARRAVGFLPALAPELAAAHEATADGPEECNPLFSPAFMSPHFGFIARVPGYLAWLAGQDMDATYGHYRRMLQLLSWRRPPARWVLKAPAHSAALGSLLRALPDAQVVLLHRDPARVVPSACSLAAGLRRILSDHLDPAELGAELADHLADSFDRAIAAHAEFGPGRILPVAYDDLVRDPVGTLRRVHAHFDLPFDPVTYDRARGWLAAHPQHKHGVHRYGLDQFGLTPAGVARRFASYHDWARSLAAAG